LGGWLYDLINSDLNSSPKNRQKVLLLAALVLLPNLIVLAILVWPGFLQADQVWSSINIKLGQPSQWHSLVFAALVFPFFDNAQGLGLYGILYDVLFSLSAAWSIVRLRTLGVLRSTGGCFGLAAVFALSPSFLFFANILYTSESVFMVALLPLTIFLMEVVASKGRWLARPGNWLRFALLLSLALELRKNAVLMVFCVLLIFLLRYRGQWRQVLAMAGVVLTTALLVTGVARLVDANPSPTQELVSIPAQQIARVYVEGGFIPEDIARRLEDIHSEEYWVESYEPSLADNEKLGIKPNAQFVADWIVLSVHNPHAYLNAYLDLTRPFWLWADKPASDENLVAGYFTGMRAWTPSYVDEHFGEGVGAQMSDGFYETMASSNPVRDTSVSVWDYLMFEQPVPVLTDVLKGVFFNIALPFYLCLAVVGVACWTRRWSLLTVASPLWATVLSFLLFAPVASLRYSAMLFMVIPVLAVMIAKAVCLQPPARVCASARARAQDGSCAGR
jgi:hypothetical protein